MTINEKPTPAAKAIRAHCLWCCCEQPNSVAQCPATACAVHPFRRGGKVSDGGTPRQSRVKAIRQRCLNCAGSAHAVGECEITTCDLFRFRFGKNPFRAPLSEEQKAAARERLAKVRAAQNEKPAATLEPSSISETV